MPHPVDPSRCPAADVLTNYSTGNLPPSSLNAVALHLEGCPHCLRSLQGRDDSLDPLLAELRQSDGVEAGDDEEFQPLLERLEGLCSERRPLPDAPSGVEPASEHRPQRFGSRRLLWGTVLGLVLLGVFVLTAGVLWHSKFDPAAPPVSITSLDVYHFRAVPDGDFYIGSLGRDSSEVSAADDSVRVLARLDQLAFGYLLAFRPDGQEQVCWPASAEQAPPATVEITYPLSGLLPLRGCGKGMYVFVLAASHRPLPSYKDWQAEHGRAPFATEAIEGTWRYHRRQWERSAPRSASGAASAPPVLVELGKFFEGRPGIDAVSVRAFPVHSLAPPPTGPPNR